MARPPEGGRQPGDPLEFLNEQTVPPEQARADDEHLARLRRERRQRLLKVGVAALVVVVLIIFVLQNSQPVEVNLLFFSGQWRLIWVIVACAALGGIVGYVIGKPGRAAAAQRRKR